MADCELDEKTGFYKVECPVAVAEMTYDVTASLTIDGAEAEKDLYSVVKYANVILSDKSFYNSFITNKTAELGGEEAAKEKFTQLVTLVVTMLDYGYEYLLSEEESTSAKNLITATYRYSEAAGAYYE